MKVFQVLKDTPNHTLEMEDEFGNRVYAVTQKYDITDFAYTKDNKKSFWAKRSTCI